jgi:hypothetical protein
MGIARDENPLRLAFQAREGALGVLIWTVGMLIWIAREENSSVSLFERGRG